MNRSFDDASIDFFFEDIDSFPFPQDTMREWIFLIIEEEKSVAGTLNFIFCSDEYLYALNVQYLNHDTLTDIITFDYSEDFNSCAGDIFISIPRITENAKDHSVDFQIELLRILSHGVLHILGYTDKTMMDKQLMTKKENFYIQKFKDD